MAQQYANSNHEGCDEIFVGAGWAGVYSFYRRVMDDPTNRGPRACLFEQSWRIGGRTYSVRINRTDTPSSAHVDNNADEDDVEFIQDVGAYRYSPDMHLPGDLIAHDLHLPTECYQDRCPSAQTDFPPNFLFNYTAPLRRMVDPQTRLPSGYATPLHRMIDIAKARGGRVFTSTGLTKFEIEEREEGEDGTIHGRVNLRFHDTVANKMIGISDPSVVVLNLPRNKLFDVEGIEESLLLTAGGNDPHVVQTLRCTAFDTPPDLFAHPLEDRPDDVSTLEKAYLYYEDAWWRTKLNVSEGEWPLPASFLTRPTPEGLRFNIRWHDGPVQCHAENKSEAKRCRGLLEIYYSVSNETFYSSLAPDPNEPLGSVWNTAGSGDDESDQGKDAAAKLSRVHGGLVGVLMPLLGAKGVSPTTIAPPTGMIVGVWNRPNLNAPLGEGYTAPTKVLYDLSMSGPPSRACGVPGLTDEAYRDTVLQPWAKRILPNVFLVNNDWVCMNVRYFYGDWAEESLLQAERAMYHLGTPRPSWLDESYYREKVVGMVHASARFAEEEIGLENNHGIAPLAVVTLAGIVIFACSLVVYKLLFSRRSKKGQYSPLS